MNDCATQRRPTRIPPSDLVAYDSWLASIDRSLVTGWRWERLGLIQTVNILGRKYVSRKAIAEFEMRAGRGEFSKSHEMPKRKAANQ
jgi:hypothetical protein